jgi:hypothetical protein
MTPDHLPQLMGCGEDHVKVGDREELLTPFCQPGCGVLVVALGATAVAAGMVNIMLLATVITLEEVSSQDLRATVENILHGSPMAGEQLLPEPAQVGTAITPKDLRHLRHVRSGRARDQP